jgi:hypothetical protein
VTQPILEYNDKINTELENLWKGREWPILGTITAL